MDPDLASPATPSAPSPNRLAPFAFFLVLTIACTWPIARDLRDHVQDAGDPLLEVAALTWASSALTDPHASILDAPQFYPYDHTQVYQNSFFGETPIFAPLWHATGNPIFAFQTTILLALFLSGLAMWGYVRHLTHDSLAGLLAGAVFAFHQYRFRNLQHLQVMSIWWWPLALWALEDLFRTRRRRSAFALALVCVAQVYCSIYMGAMLLVLLLVRGLVEWVAEPRLRMDSTLYARIGAAALVTAVCIAPLAAAYLAVMRAFPAGHDMEVVTQFSASPRDYLRLGLSSVPYYWLRARAAWQYTFDQFVLFPGLVPVVLALYGCLSVERSSITQGRPGAPTRRVAWTLVFVSLVAVILSLGPYLKMHGRATDVPLPALFLYHRLPGYTIFRVNTRFAFLLLFALSIGVGMAYAAFTRRRTRTPIHRYAVFACGLALLLGESWNAPVPSQPIAVGAGLAPVYRALADDADAGALVHIPFGPTLYEEIWHVYAGLEHRRRLVNGYSTFEPPGYRQFRELAARGPSLPLWSALAAWDVRTIVVDYGAMPQAMAAAWRRARSFTGIEVQREFDQVEIWKLATAPNLIERPALIVQAPADVEMGESARVTVTFTAPQGTVWRCPRPLGLRSMTATWQPLHSGAVVETRVRVLHPLFVVWANPVSTTVTVTAPLQAGEYTLNLTGEICGGSARVRVRQAASGNSP